MEDAHSPERQNKDEASIVARMREGASAQIEAQKSRATDGLGSVAQAARETTRQLREQHNDTVADYVEEAAAQLERFSKRLKEKDISELVGDAQRLARRHPALFIGSAFTIGLLGARFMKSSASGGDGGYGLHDNAGRSMGYAGRSPEYAGRMSDRNQHTSPRPVQQPMLPAAAQRTPGQGSGTPAYGDGRGEKL